MDRCKSTLATSRWLGLLSAVFFFTAAVGVVDALQTIVRQQFNQIDLVAGETITFTGNMPQGVTSVDAITATIEPPTGVTLRFTEAFSGFWLGGNMWRAEISMPANAPQGVVSVIINDIWTETTKLGETVHRQNPALIYPLHVWKDARAQDIGSGSYCKLYAGMPPLLVSAVAFAIAAIFGFFQWFIFRKADSKLMQEGYYFIHGIKRTDDKVLALVRLAKQKDIALDDAVVLYDNKLNKQGRGLIVELDEENAVAKFTGALNPRYGWFLQLSTNAV